MYEYEGETILSLQVGPSQNLLFFTQQIARESGAKISLYDKM